MKIPLSFVMLICTYVFAIGTVFGAVVTSLVYGEKARREPAGDEVESEMVGRQQNEPGA